MTSTAYQMVMEFGRQALVNRATYPHICNGNGFYLCKKIKTAVYGRQIDRRERLLYSFIHVLGGEMPIRGGIEEV